MGTEYVGIYISMLVVDLVILLRVLDSLVFLFGWELYAYGFLILLVAILGWLLIIDFEYGRCTLFVLFQGFTSFGFYLVVKVFKEALPFDVMVWLIELGAMLILRIDL